MGLRVTQHTVLQPGDSIEQNQRRQFAARQNEVAETQLDVDVTVEKSLIDALVPAAQQHRTRPNGEFGDHLLIDLPTDSLTDRLILI